MTDKVEIDTTQTEVKYGDVLFTTSSETPEEVGMSSVWLGDTPNTYLNSFCFGFRPKQKIDLYFLGYSLRAPYMRDKIKILAQGISRYNISKNKVMELEISLPNNEEQNLLGNFLRHIDLIITLHQRKLNNLKLKKKALLQKLFPKNGERYPELRFPGFTDAWEQRKFGELFILKSGVAFKLSEYTKTGIPIINGESIKAGKISLEKINYLPNEYQYKYQECLLFPGDIVLGLNRPIIDGTLKISRIPADIKKSLLYQRAGKIIFKVNMDENFTYQLLSKEVLTFTKKEAVGSDQPFITTTKLNKWDLYFPVKDKERRNIGSLFNNIDNIITLHQRKLDHLQLQKKALLQQMFV
jgi:type I restriction enzyme S subunit